jgi:hypothetical protein
MGLLPALAWFAWFAVLQRSRTRSLALGQSGLLLYSLSYVSVEGLSALGLLSAWALAVFWLAVVLAAAAWRMSDSRPALRRSGVYRSPAERLMLAWVGLSAVLVLGLGLIAAPNNWDSMSYHLSRVAQWAARGSVAFYPSGISRQLSQPPAAEYAMLQLYLLGAGTDRLLAAVQGSALLMAAAALWRLTRLAGASVPASTLPGAAGLVQAASGLVPGVGVAQAVQAASGLVPGVGAAQAEQAASGPFPGKGPAQRAAHWAVFALACSPMALLQASSTQNDLVVGALLLWTAYFGLRFARSGQLAHAAWAGLAAALAWASKGTAWLLFPPLLLGLLWASRCHGPGKLLRAGGLGLLLILMLAAPHALRNQRAFGSALGPDYGLAVNAHTPAERLQAALLNGAKNAGYSLRSPWAALNATLERGVHALHGLSGTDVNDGRYHWPPSPGFSLVISGPGQALNEDYAPSPVPAWLLLIALMGLAYKGLKLRRRLPVASALLLFSWLGAALLFSAALRWQVWHGRLLLPLLLLGLPLLGHWLARRRPAAQAALGLLLVAGALPPLLYNQSRPLLGAKSVLTTPRQEQYFINRPELLPAYREAAAAVREHGASQTLLYLSGDSWEYPLWVLARPDAPLRSLMDTAAVPQEASLLLSWKAEWNARDTLQLGKQSWLRQGPEPQRGAPAAWLRLP